MRKIISLLMLVLVIGAASAASTWYPRSDNYTTSGWIVAAVEVRYSVAASSGPTNVTLKKCTVGEAPASGDAITSPMLLNGTTNLVYSYTPIAGSEGITVADTLCLDYSGTMTSLAGGTVTITMKRV